MTHFTSPTQNPIPSVLAMLDGNPTNEVAILIINDILSGQAICVYTANEDPFAVYQTVLSTPTNLQEYHEATVAAQTPKTLVIAAGENGLFVAAVIGLVHRHNVGIRAARASYDEAMRQASEAAAARFIKQAIIDYYFGIDFGSDVQAGGASGPARRFANTNFLKNLPIADSVSDSSFGGGI